jgi:serine protease AprX
MRATTGAQAAQAAGLTGKGIGVAIIDSGVSPSPDFDTTPGSGITRLIRPVVFGSEQSLNDTLGHGTHVAGIIGGNGAKSGGVYSGIAPGATLISLKVGGASGQTSESNVIGALQWVYDHKAEYNIRVVNLSLNSSVEQSYHTSPLNAAVEILWFNGVVVVTSIGNAIDHGAYYNTTNAAPANDPFVISVGASTELLTANRNDDFYALFASRGVTSDGFSKPDLVAPGTGIISVNAPGALFGVQHPSYVVATNYMNLSGTSMAAPMVSGAVALLLQQEPRLTPDQVKYRLVKQAGTISPVLSTQKYPYLDIMQALQKPKTTPNLNTGTAASRLLWSGNTPINWNSVAWNSVAWNSVAWNSVAWNSVAWNSVAWNSIYWETP